MIHTVTASPLVECLDDATNHILFMYLLLERISCLHIVKVTVILMTIS